MAKNDKHELPIGVGYPDWDSGARPTKLMIFENSNNLGSWLELSPMIRDEVADDDGHRYRLNSITMQDAEALCYLLYDLTQPLRDAREKALKEQGGTDG